MHSRISTKCKSPAENSKKSRPIESNQTTPLTNITKHVNCKHAKRIKSRNANERQPNRGEQKTKTKLSIVENHHNPNSNNKHIPTSKNLKTNKQINGSMQNRNFQHTDQKQLAKRVNWGDPCPLQMKPNISHKKQNQCLHHSKKRNEILPNHRRS